MGSDSDSPVMQEAAKVLEEFGIAYEYTIISAHHTIEGFYTSQYEQLLRILLNMPLGSTEMKMPCAMINIVGPNDKSGKYRLKYFNELNAMHGVYVHLYGKKESKPNRKLGHVTVVQPSREKVLEITKKIRPLIKVEIIKE